MVVSDAADGPEAGRDAPSGEVGASDRDVTSAAGPLPHAFDEGLASALRIAVMRLARRMRAETSDETMTLTQLSALATIAKHGPLSPTALAERERVQPPSMTRVIAILEERNLLSRVAHPSDRRQSVIELSAIGRAVIDEDRRRRTALLARVLDDLEPAERATLAAAVPVLERLARD